MLNRLAVQRCALPHYHRKLMKILNIYYDSCGSHKQLVAFTVALHDGHYIFCDLYIFIYINLKRTFITLRNLSNINFIIFRYPYKTGHELSNKIHSVIELRSR